MDTRRDTRWYDLFKLIVALILLALLFIFWLRPVTTPQVAGQVETGDKNDSNAVVLASATPLPTVVTQAPSETATPPSSATAPLPTATFAPTATTAPTKVPATPTATLAAVEEPTATPVLTSTPAPTAAETATPAPEAVQLLDCPQAQTSQLTVGAKARIMSNLNMRSAAGTSNSVIRTNAAGTVLEIISGPVCESAYLWWEVRAPDGTSGWSAETSANGSFYFLQPLP